MYSRMIPIQFVLKSTWNLFAFILISEGCVGQDSSVTEPGTTDSIRETDGDNDTESDTIIGLDTDMDSATDTDSSIDADTDTDIDADTDTDIDADTDTDIDADTDTEVDADTDTDIDADTDTDIDADTDTEVDADTDMDMDADTGTDTDIVADTDTDTDIDTDTDTETDADTDTDINADTDINTEIEIDSATDTEAETALETESETDSNLDSGSDFNTESVPDTDSVFETDSDINTGLDSEEPADTEVDFDTTSDADTIPVNTDNDEDTDWILVPEPFRNQEVVVVLPSDDAEVKAGSAKDTNFGLETYWQCKDFEDTPEWGWVLAHVFIRFDLTGFTSEQIGSAFLSVYGNLADGSTPVQLTIWETDDAEDDWDENTITWNNQPSKISTDPAGSIEFTLVLDPLDYQARYNEGQWEFSTDISNIVLNELNGNGILTIRLENPIMEEAFGWSKEHPLGVEFGNRLVILPPQ